jgi:hypothetical protein
VPGNVKILCRACNSREQVFRRHPRKRCPAGRTCPRPPSGTFTCCEGA